MRKQCNTCSMDVYTTVGQCWSRETKAQDRKIQAGKKSYKQKSICQWYMRRQVSGKEYTGIIYLILQLGRKGVTAHLPIREWSVRSWLKEHGKKGKFMRWSTITGDKAISCNSGYSRSKLILILIFLFLLFLLFVFLFSRSVGGEQSYESNTSLDSICLNPIYWYVSPRITFTFVFLFLSCNCHTVQWKKKGHRTLPSFKK